MDKPTMIRHLNDRFREFLDIRFGAVAFTPGFQGLTSTETEKALAAIQNFDEFEEGNDPYGEHDFGSVTVDGKQIIWKIDYFADSRLREGSEDPADLSRCFRVLTIMLAEEY